MIKSFLLSCLFLSNFALATEEAAPSGKAAFMSFLPLIIIFIVFYFLIMRPQQKKAKEFANMLDNLKIGTKVVTAGGIIGIIKAIDKEKDLFTVVISDNVDVLIYKKSITNVFDLDENK